MAKQSAGAFIIPILLACAAILAVYSSLPGQPGAAPQQEGGFPIDFQGGSGAQPAGGISLSLQGGPLVSGNTASLRAVSACGEFGVSLDGAWFGNGSPLLSSPFLLQEGSHVFSAQGKGCNSTLAFTVLARACAANETKECERNGCPGIRKCAGGLFSECALLKKVCSPGEKVGCHVDSCSSGHMVCNPCGTSFGKCLPGAIPKNEDAACAAP
ncbi:MAG: hypothetical protein WC263_02370 [Candidatus Micrarchaeia archaeon]|jgi:hypothetical protein